MQPNPPTRHDSRTLLVDANVAQGAQLAEQLILAGFKTDFAVGWRLRMRLSGRTPITRASWVQTWINGQTASRWFDCGGQYPVSG